MRSGDASCRSSTAPRGRRRPRPSSSSPRSAPDSAGSTQRASRSITARTSSAPRSRSSRPRTGSRATRCGSRPSSRRSRGRTPRTCRTTRPKNPRRRQATPPGVAPLARVFPTRLRLLLLPNPTHLSRGGPASPRGFPPRRSSRPSTARASGALPRLYHRAGAPVDRALAREPAHGPDRLARAALAAAVARGDARRLARVRGGGRRGHGRAARHLELARRGPTFTRPTQHVPRQS